MRSWIIAGCLAVGMGALGGCSQPANCTGGVYGGGCLSSTGVSVAASSPMPPGTAAPGIAPPSAAMPAAAPPAMEQGNLSPLDAADDRQCRSYGLTFGTWDYAQCRIALSAQHRGIPPAPSGK